MSEPSPPINPYAPPACSPDVVPGVNENFIWREGDGLVIRAGANLPAYCLLTGEPAPYSHPISQIWQPRWAYLLVLLAVVPYLLLSPFVHRRVEILVPFGRTVYRKHQRWVKLGIALILAGVLLVVGFVASTLGQWLTGPDALMLVIGVGTFLLGLQIASSSPMRLNISKVEGDLIFIDNVHAKYLARLPDTPEFATAAWSHLPKLSPAPATHPMRRN